MYTNFFQLNKKPFDLVPNPEFLYPSRSHKRALTFLNYGIQENAGFILLTGEVGSGKTTLMRNMIKDYDVNVNYAYIFHTKVDTEQLLMMINNEFGLDVDGKSKGHLLRDLNDYLIKQFADGRRSVIVIDEAQNLSNEVLEEVRMLSNLETNDTKIVQIILTGQPELKTALSIPELRQLRQRISISCHIYPLTRAETEEYILHRLEIAGNREAVRFSDEILELIHEFSRGIPRLINIICDLLMVTLCVEGTRDPSADMVKEIADELANENCYWKNQKPAEPIEVNRDLGHLYIRIGRVEEEVYKNRITPFEKAEIFERLLRTEQRMKVVMNTYQKRIDSLRKKVDDLKEHILSNGLLHTNYQDDK